MANALKAKFEDLAKEKPLTPYYEEQEGKNWTHSGNTGGGHSGFIRHHTKWVPTIINFVN